MKKSKQFDLRIAANVAHADAASIATSVMMLREAEREVLIDKATRDRIAAGIVSKCRTCCATLQLIDRTLGGSLGVANEAIETGEDFVNAIRELKIMIVDLRVRMGEKTTADQEVSQDE